jgi:hypothetical protein
MNWGRVIDRDGATCSVRKKVCSVLVRPGDTHPGIPGPMGAGGKPFRRVDGGKKTLVDVKQWGDDH